MILVNDLEFDKDTFRKVFDVSRPYMPANEVHAIEDWLSREKSFIPWDSVKDDPDLVLYTPETLTDFSGVYLDVRTCLEWCKNYVEGGMLPVYGVADNVSQILAYTEQMVPKDILGVISVMPVFRAMQPARDGWRWHKWGPYIGTFKPMHEYLRDEEGIESVLCFRVVPLQRKGRA